MVTVSSPDRVVFPDAGVTKAAAVAYFERVAHRMLPHLVERPLSIRRFPRGLAGPGFFQKNLPPHYPATFGRLEVPRSQRASRRHKDADARERDVTVYPVVREAEHVPYVANQGALELHVPTARVDALMRPDRLVIDLDPPAAAPVSLVRHAAHAVRAMLEEVGLSTVPVATGSKGYHVVAVVKPADGEAVTVGLQRFAALAAAREPSLLTTAFRVASRGHRVFVDWLRNAPLATVIAPYSLRARPRATLAVPLAWSEVDTVAPDTFTIADVDAVVAREDPLHAAQAQDAAPALAAIEASFAAAGLTLERFDRFRS